MEKITRYQMANQPSVILMDHWVPNKLVHAVLNTVIVEVLQFIANVPSALTIEHVRFFKMSHMFRKNDMAAMPWQLCYGSYAMVRSREYRFTHMNRSTVDIPFLSEALSGERI